MFKNRFIKIFSSFTRKKHDIKENRLNYYELRRKTKPTDFALNHFDINYSKVFGKKWRSIRLGLLSPNKHVAVLNTFSNTEETESRLKLQRAINLGYHYEKYWKKFKRHQAKMKKLEEKRQAIINSDPDKSNEENVRLSDLSITESDSDLTSSTASEAKILFSSDSEGDESRYFNAASTNLSFNTFVPISEMISQEEDKITVREYNLDENYKISIKDQDKLEIPDNLIVYINKRGVLTYSKTDEDDEDNEENSDIENEKDKEESMNQINFGRNPILNSFEYPKKNLRNNLLNYYVMDSASILPILCLDLKKDDVVGDFCAAPGGKSLATFLTKLPSRIMMNDNSLSRSQRLQIVMKSYLPKKEINQKIDFRTLDGEKLIEKDGFDKIIVDVPCTNDKISVLSNQNNIFKSSRLKERLNLPNRQISILLAALNSLKINGTLVYSTCSLSPTQNDFVVRAALESIEKTTDFKFVVTNLKEAFRPFKPLYKLFNCTYGQLVLPFVPSNGGPLYFSKITRTQ